ncbi:unnamed protein product, partial [Nesidiocoris tenuis]
TSIYGAIRARSSRSVLELCRTETVAHGRFPRNGSRSRARRGSRRSRSTSRRIWGNRPEDLRPDKIGFIFAVEAISVNL